jgi:hypothetical protein
MHGTNWPKQETIMFKWLLSFFASSAASHVVERILPDVKSIPQIAKPKRKYKERDKTQLTDTQLKHLLNKKKDGISYSDLTIYANTKYGINKGMSTYHRLLKKYEESLNKGN